MSKINDDFPGAARLVEAGYGTTTKIDNATDEELLAIEGIGPATLEKIREARQEPIVESVVESVDDAPLEAVAEIEPTVVYTCSNPACGHEIAISPCPYCGQ